MPIPDIDVFNELLDSLTLRRPLAFAEFDQLEAVPERLLSDLPSIQSTGPIWLWYRKACTLTPPRLLDRLRKELQTKSHASGTDMALALLAVLCLSSRTSESPASRLNSLIAMIGSAETAQYLIAPFPPHPDFRQFSLGSFTIGPLKRERLVYWCRKVGCDFFERYPNRFLHRFAIERTTVKAQVLDWGRVRESLNISPSNLAPILVDHYFEIISRYLQNAFRSDFRVAQEIFVAAGAPYIDLDQSQAWNGGTFVCLFQNIGKQRTGYFCPLDTGLSIDFAQADRRFPSKAEELKKAFAFTSIGSSEIHKTLETYCRFIVKAKIHESEGRHDEAFLHYIIALDLLFGEKDVSTQKITKRAAIAVSRQLDGSFENSVEDMKTLYDRRSRYVHAGEPVGDLALEAVHPIVNEVLFCLLRLQADPSNRREGFIDYWLKTLDYLIAATEAGKPVAEKDLVAAGIAPAPELQGTT